MEFYKTIQEKSGPESDGANSSKLKRHNQKNANGKLYYIAPCIIQKTRVKITVAKNPRQQSLFYAPKPKLSHGGEQSLGKRKTARFSPPRKWIHVVLKSKRAIGRLNFFQGDRRGLISQLIRSQAKNNYIELGDAVIMGNHIHLKLRLRRKEDFKKFLRSVAGRIAAIVTGAKKGRPFGRFWDSLAFTRVLNSAFEDLQLRGYFEANRIERNRGKSSRALMLKAFNAWTQRLKKINSSG